MKMDKIFEWGFFSMITILLISISMFVGYQIGTIVDSDRINDIIVVKRCGKKIISFE